MANPRGASRPTWSDVELRAARRDRVFDAMAAAGLDLLVLGRRDSVAYATGARSLWTAGTRPFAAVGVLVVAHQSIHLLSTWDAGVPPEVPFDHLYGITWNPGLMAASLAAIPGLPEARRIGVDALSPGFQRAARRLAPQAELVPADDLLRGVRAVKLPGEIERIRVAVAVAKRGVEAAATALVAGATPSQARAAAMGAVTAPDAPASPAAIVAPVPAAARVAPVGAHGRLDGAVPSSGPVVQVVDPSRSLVHVDVGVLVDGYEGGLGRTVPSSGDRSHVAAPLDALADLQGRLLARCRPGATAADLRGAARAGGAVWWMVRGAGMGFEPPVVTDRLGEGVVIDEGLVLSVAIELDGLRRRELALVGPAGAEAF